ncbi:MAG: DUF4440 domain-containing protein [Gemmatimonadales bacterium]|nr:DUF4440 domain-containing protein [Gemmatimonadales bacterium]
MSTRSVLLAALALALVTSACQPPAQEAGPLSEEDVAAIRSSTESFAQAMLAGDPATVAGFFAEDAVAMPPNEPAVEGRAAIQAWLEALPTVTQDELRLVEVTGRGEIAYGRGTYTLTVMPEGAPEPITDRGKYVAIFRKQPDGSWLIAVDIWNSDQPLPQEGSGT